jgi:hypothetical protein
MDVTRVSLQRFKTLHEQAEFVSHLGTACYAIAALAASGILAGIGALVGPGVDPSLAVWLIVDAAVVLVCVALGAVLRLASEAVKMWADQQTATVPPRHAVMRSFPS